MSRKLLEKPLALMHRFRSGSESQLTDTISPSLSADSSDENKENDAGSKTKKKDSTSNRNIWYISSAEPPSLELTNPTACLSSSVPSTISDSASENPLGERKASRTKPKGTIEIEVPLDGTLNNLAAHYDTTPSELIKLNRLGSRMVFPGQILLIPDPDYITTSEPSSPEISTSPVFSPPADDRPRVDIPIVKMADKPPAKIPGHVERQTSLPSPQDKKDVGIVPHKLSDEDVQSLDQECFERFIKINVKHITDGQGVVGGTLLVTPNAVMFDPNVSDPLVMEHGPEKYGMITPMDMVISAAMYHDIAAMRTRRRPKQDDDNDESHSGKHQIYHAKDCPLHLSGSAIFHGSHHYGDETDACANEAVKHSTTNDSLASSTTACSCGALSRQQSLLVELDIDDGNQDLNVSQSRSGDAMDGQQPDGLSVVAADGKTMMESRSDSVHPSDDDGVVQTSAVAHQKSGENEKPPVVGIRDNPFQNGLRPSDDAQSSNSVTRSSEGVRPSSGVSDSSPGGVNFFLSGDRSSDGVEPSLDRVESSPLALTADVSDSLICVNDSLTGANSSSEGANDSPATSKHSSSDGRLSNDGAGPSLGSAALSAGETETDSRRNIPGDDSVKETRSISGSHETETSRLGGVIVESTSRASDAIGDDDKDLSDGVGTSDSDSSLPGSKDLDANATNVQVPNVSDCNRLALEGTTSESKGSSDSRSAEDSSTAAIKSLNLPNTPLSRSKMENGESGESRIGNIIYLPFEENVDGEMVLKAPSTAQVKSAQVKGVPMPTPATESAGDGDGGVRSASDTNMGVRAIKSSAQHLSSFVNYATGLFRSSTDDRLNVKDITEVMAASSDSSRGAETGAGLKAHPFLEVANAIRLEDKPELFQTFDKLIARPAAHAEDPPLYLCLRVGHPKNKEVSQTCPIESYRANKKKPEYWFSIPRAKVDALYAFFVQWTPDIYGDLDEIDPEIRGFVVIDDEEETEEENLEIIDEHFASIQKIRKDWEIISKEEALRRMSTVDDDASLLPELSGETTLLSEDHLTELSRNLPPRTIGYAWTLIYSTELHGFSLKTLYRYMCGIDSPILLVVMDTNGHVFGAMTSCAIKMSDHFYGTGESFLFTFYPEFKIFHWTGENNFFLKGNQESLAIGAGQGLFGLWFDGDLYHGRSHRCETFDNDVLTVTEDFVVKGLEAWAFV